jgi:hypothetical protein
VQHRVLRVRVHRRVDEDAVAVDDHRDDAAVAPPPRLLVLRVVPYKATSGWS